MCFNRKPDPRIAQEQAKQDSAAKEAKEVEKQAAQRAQAKEIESEKERAVNVYKAEQAAKRQAAAAEEVRVEAARQKKKADDVEKGSRSFSEIRQDRISKMGAANTKGTASRRSGARSRRSLITGLGGGIGYYDRFSS